MNFKRILSLLLIASMLVFAGCNSAPSTSDEETTAADAQTDVTETPPETEPQIQQNPGDALVYETDDTNLRVLLTSDTHYTHLMEWYGTDEDTRMQHWVDTIKKEHAENPFDLILIMGDLSLDHWATGGSVINEGVSTAKVYLEKYVSQLPDDVPRFILAGNHEQFTNEQWFEMTGNYRSGTVLLGDTLFILLDNFSGELDPDYHHDGIYTPVDVNYVRNMMAAYPDTDVYLVAHGFLTDKESADFKKLVASEDRIKGMFMGHTHLNDVVELGSDWGGKTIAQTGSFAYTRGQVRQSFWGFRELVITGDYAYSQYIMAESDANINGRDAHFDRITNNPVVYYGTAPIEAETKSDSLSLDLFKNLFDYIDQASIDGDEGMKATNAVQLALDNDIKTKWCVRPTSKDGSVTMTWATTEPVRMDAYAFTTAGDCPDRNPDAWILSGRKDPMGEWVILDTVEGDANIPVDFFTTSDVFLVDNPGDYQYYKLTVTENFNNRDLYQFTELHMLRYISTDDYNLLYDKVDRDSVTGEEGAAPSESVGKIFDNKTASKWCVNKPAADASVTVQWAMTEPLRIDAYAFMTANDSPDRNPDCWTLYGSNSPSGEWTVLSAVEFADMTTELFAASDIYTIAKPAEYQYYKLHITGNNNGGSIYQFSELMLMQNK